MSIPCIIIPVLNRYELLDTVISSIDFPVDNLIVIDNGGKYSLPTTMTYVKKASIINMPSNIGVAASWNLGIKCFPHSRYWLVGSNDNAWSNGSLERFHELSNQDTLVLSALGWNSFSIGSQIIKDIGIFDENYYPAYHEDTDYIERMRLAGASGRIVHSDIALSSFGAGVTAKSNPHYTERLKTIGEDNRLYYMNKIYGDDEHYNCYKWDLQRRIDNDWELNG